MNYYKKTNKNIGRSRSSTNRSTGRKNSNIKNTTNRKQANTSSAKNELGPRSVATKKPSSQNSYAKTRKNPVLDLPESHRKKYIRKDTTGRATRPTRQGRSPQSIKSNVGYDDPILGSIGITQKKISDKPLQANTQRRSMAKPVRSVRGASNPTGQESQSLNSSREKKIRKKRKVNTHTKNPKSNQQRSSTKSSRSKNKSQEIITNRKGKTIIDAEKGTMRIIPIGGCEEVGRNMTVFEYTNKRNGRRDIVVLDMGLQFPEEDMPGIDYIIPNIDYLKGKEKDIRAVVFSHGHLDHIGAAPILLEKLGYPVVIGRNMTMEMIKHRTEDYKKGSTKRLKIRYIKSLSEVMALGEFKLKFFAVEHAIIDAVGVILESPAGTAIHPGDWTIEKDPQGRPLVSYNQLAELKSPKILMLESLAVTHKEARNFTEKDMLDNLTNLIVGAPGRVIIGTFASQIIRIGQLIDIAKKHGKKIALDGYSLKMNMELASRLGYVKMPKDALINIKDIDKYDNKKLVILCTGAQGESNAVMSRIVNNNHKYVKVQKNDTVVFSSSVIPGNERTIQRLKDNMYRLSDNVIHSDIMDVHISGHGCQEDIREMMRQIKPDYFMPVYANHYMLKEAALLVEREGFVPKENIIVPDNGSVIEFYENKRKKPQVLNDKAVTDYVFVDGLGVGDISNIVLRDRQMMAADGMIVVIVTIDKHGGRLLHSPDLISRGFVYMKENQKLISDTRDKVKQIVNSTDPKIDAFPDYVKNKIRDDVGKFLFQKTERRPMVLPVVIEV